MPVELELRHILYATNLTSASLKVASAAIALAEEFEARLTLMHVIESYANLEDRPGPIETGVEQLQSVVPRAAALAYAPEIVMEFGSAWQCIVNTAAEREADLIILGARCRWHGAPAMVDCTPGRSARHLPGLDRACISVSFLILFQARQIRA